MSVCRYQGGELELFRDATTWKGYFASLLRPYIGRRVLEVGPGIGGTTRVLCSGREAAWLCLEPDAELVAVLARRSEPRGASYWPAGARERILRLGIQAIRCVSAKMANSAVESPTAESDQRRRGTSSAHARG